jgi:hypothetical protein
MEQSAWNETHKLINYGTGGYGFDQTVLAMKRALGRFEGRNPVIVLSALVDDDLDRIILRIRDHPRPHFLLRPDGGIELEEDVLEPEAFTKAHPIAIQSYAWRWLLYGSGLIPPRTRRWAQDEDEQIEFKQELTRRLLDLAVAELDSRGLAHFFVLFHGRPSLDVGRQPWQEAFLLEELQTRGIPYVSSRPLIVLASIEQREGTQAFYRKRGQGRNHLNEAGNRVVFEAFERGLRGSFDRPEEQRWMDFVSHRTQGDGVRAHFQPEPPGEPETPARLVFECQPGSSIECSYRPLRSWKRLSCRVLVESELPASAGSATLSLHADGEELRRLELRSEAAAEALVLDLSEVHEWTLRISGDASNATRMRVCLLSPRIE